MILFHHSSAAPFFLLLTLLINRFIQKHNCTASCKSEVKYRLIVEHHLQRKNKYIGLG